MAEGIGGRSFKHLKDLVVSISIPRDVNKFQDQSYR